MSNEKLSAIVTDIVEKQEEFEKLEKLLPLGEPKFGQWPKKRKRLNRREQTEQLALRGKGEKLA